MIELNADNFESDVIDRSRSMPVLVDFWADWCAPCKMLTPVLVNLAAEYQDRLQIGKVNTDEQRTLAEQHAIRSLPTLRLYRNGEMVEEVLGAQPESVLRELIEAHLVRASDSTLQEALALAATGQAAAAIPLLEQVMQDDSGNSRAPLELARLCIAEGQLERATTLLENLPRELRDSEEGRGLKFLLEFACAAEGADTDALAAALESNPGDSASRYQLAAQQVTSGDYDAALANFLELLKRDRGYGEGAARRGLLTLFSLLDEGDERIGQYRRKMASLLL